MNNALKRLGVVNRAKIVACLTISIGLIAFQRIAAQDKGYVTQTSPLSRFLLVASEGLYVVEADGSCSWSYQPANLGQQVRGMEDDIIYDGFALENGHYLFSTHRYIREIDRDKRTVWEYRLIAPAEVKSGVPLPNGGVAVLNSEEQAILELKAGTNTVVSRIPVPAKGTDHTRYMLLRRTPGGNYLVALREEQQLIEVNAAGQRVHSFSVPAMPVMAQRLSDGSTIGTGKFGMVKLDADWNNTWSYAAPDAGAQFPLLTSWGVTELSDHRLIVANSDWHLGKKDDNRVQFFAVDAKKNISWTLPASAYDPWKRSEVEPRTGLTEHRSVVVWPLPSNP
jgi:hypothetical protein